MSPIERLFTVQLRFLLTIAVRVVSITVSLARALARVGPHRSHLKMLDLALIAETSQQRIRCVRVVLSDVSFRPGSRDT